MYNKRQFAVRSVWCIGTHYDWSRSCRQTAALHTAEQSERHLVFVYIVSYVKIRYTDHCLAFGKPALGLCHAFKLLHSHFTEYKVALPHSYRMLWYGRLRQMGCYDLHQIVFVKLIGVCFARSCCVLQHFLLVSFTFTRARLARHRTWRNIQNIDKDSDCS